VNNEIHNWSIGHYSSAKCIIFWSEKNLLADINYSTQTPKQTH